MIFVRARQPAQKEERRAQVLDAARQMLAEGARLHDLSLNELARRAAMTKSNVYRYFESREAVFLELMQEAWLEWMTAIPDALAEQLSAIPVDDGSGTDGTDPRPTIDAVVEAFVQTLNARRPLCMLTSALPTVLEENLTVEAVLAFKQASLASFEAIADMVVTAAPSIPRAAALQVLHDGVVLIAGLYPVCFPAQSVRQVLASAPELQCFRHDFVAELRRLLRATLHDSVRHSRAAV